MSQLLLHDGRITLVDPWVFNWAQWMSWHVNKSVRNKIGYVTSTVRHHSKGTDRLYLHRLIVNPPDGFAVDHINGDTLDNRCCNLRMASLAQNMANRTSRQDRLSRFKGLNWDRQYSRWIVRISVNKRRIIVGYFTDEVDAARAYNEAAKIHHGEFALLNEVPNA
jgi:hypothetical protein